MYRLGQSRCMRQATAIMLAMSLLAMPVLADDPDPPELKDLRIDRVVLSPGETLYVTMEWHDASPVLYTDASATGPAGLELRDNRCPERDPERILVVTCQIRIPDRAPSGAYAVSHAWAQDEVGHVANVFTDVGFTVESPYNDTEPPVVSGVDVHVGSIEPAVDRRVLGAFTLAATDESGLRDGHVQFEGPGGNGALWGQCDAVVEGGLLCDLHALPDLPGGIYRATSVGASDSIGYRVHYSDDPAWFASPPLAAALPDGLEVEVISNETDVSPPTLTAVTFPGQLHRGQPFVLRINATDETGLLHNVVWFRTTRGNADYAVETIDCEGSRGPASHLECTGTFPNNYPLGQARLGAVYLSDPAHNSRHFVPVEWGYVGEHKFEDDAQHDVATVLVPRPIEGAIEAIDAVVNEVAPGEVATLVYLVKDTVDDAIESVTFILESVEDGSMIEASCPADVVGELGIECDVTVPADANGVYRLKEAIVQREVKQETLSYGADAVPVLAVATSMPADSYDGIGATDATGGSANSIGRDDTGDGPRDEGRPAPSDFPKAEPAHDATDDAWTDPPDHWPGVDLGTAGGSENQGDPGASGASPVVDVPRDRSVPGFPGALMAWALCVAAYLRRRTP